MRPLRVLLTNIRLAGGSGTEIVTRDLALGLRRRGHRPIVYTPQAGRIASELREASIPVTTSIDGIAEPPDVIHGHHNAVVAIAIARFPAAPAIFVCNDFVAWHDAPPLFPSIRRYVAIDRLVAERLGEESGIVRERVVLQLNAVDLERFAAPSRALPDRPARALAFVKNIAHLEAVRAACEARGLPLDVAGGAAGAPVAAPETLLPRYDLVFATALSALEAMVSGCAVIVADARGLAGFATPSTYRRWRPYNFGLRILTRPTTAAHLVEEIDRYDADAARRVTMLARASADMNRLVDRYVALYRACIAGNVPVDREAHDRAVARHWERWSPRYGGAWPWMIERERLVSERDAACARPPRLAAGEVVRCGERRPGIEYAVGFSDVEDWGVWTVGPRAILAFRVSPEASTVEVSLEARALVVPERPELTVSVRANGRDAGSWTFRLDDAPPAITAHAPLLGTSGLVVLELAIDDPRSPRELGYGADDRPLGLGLIALEVRGFDYADSAS